MGWTITIGRVAGTEVKVHLTFFILVAFWAMGGYREGGAPGAVLATLSLLALFACIVLHEFGHILVARRFGIQTPDVILLPIGGVARLQRIPDEPRQELLIALGGPAVTFAIVVLLYLWLTALGRDPQLWGLRPDGPFLETMMQVNLYLLLFNLVPAFPMDGGRVLRALLASRLGLVEGTRIAARLGQACAVLAGFYALTTGRGLLVLVALFVFLGAGAEAAAVETRAAGAGLSAAQMMVTHFRSIPIHATLAEAVELLLSGEQREFPVVDNLGRVEGILTRDHIIKGLSQRGAGSIVGEVMAAQAPLVAPTLGFQEALERLRASGLPALPVVDATGRLVGLLTMDNITDLLLVRRAGSPLST